MLCISGRRLRADDRDEMDMSGSEVEEIRDSSVIDASLAATHAGESLAITHASLKSVSHLVIGRISFKPISFAQNVSFSYRLVPFSSAKKVGQTQSRSFTN